MDTNYNVTNQNGFEQPVKEKRGLSGSTLKMIAIVTMLIDHIGAAILGRMLMANGMGSLDGTDLAATTQWLSENGTLYYTYMIFRMIGRVAFPIFCFLLVQGFLHTSNKKKYALRLCSGRIYGKIFRHYTRLCQRYRTYE